MALTPEQQALLDVFVVELQSRARAQLLAEESRWASLIQNASTQQIEQARALGFQEGEQAGLAAGRTAGEAVGRGLGIAIGRNQGLDEAGTIVQSFEDDPIRTAEERSMLFAVRSSILSLKTP